MNSVLKDRPKAKDILPPELLLMFRETEARHLTEEELKQYAELMPYEAHRADAAREAYAVELQVVEDSIDGIFEAYPYTDHHALSVEKCARDVTNVSTYAIQSMLMNDPQWFSDKLLLWLKTILQAFRFPSRLYPKETVLFGSDKETEIINSLPPYRQSVYETYFLLDRNYEQSLQESSYELLRPHLEMIRHTLGGE